MTMGGLNGNFIENLYNHSIRHIMGMFRFKKFGKGSWIAKPILVKGGKDIEIGDHVGIRHFLRIEALKQNPLQSSPCITIGSLTNIEQNVHITAGEKVMIGESCSLLGGCVITDIIHPYEDPGVPASRQKMVCKPVQIGDRCFIGMHAMVMPGVTLGKHVVVGANSVVTHDLPDYSIVAGVPGKVIKQYDRNIGEWKRI